MITIRHRPCGTPVTSPAPPDCVGPWSRHGPKMSASDPAATVRPSHLLSPTRSAIDRLATGAAERARCAVGCLLGHRLKKIMELSGFVEEKVDRDPPEFPPSPGIPLSLEILLDLHPARNTRHQHTGPPGRPGPNPGDQRRTIASITNRRAAQARAQLVRAALAAGLLRSGPAPVTRMDGLRDATPLAHPRRGFGWKVA